MGLFRKKSSKDASNQNPSWNLKAMVSRLKRRSNFDWDNLLVIGIDFGTTYSGAAWATVPDIENDNISIIQSWPGTGRQEGKAPTSIYYDDDDSIMWGYSVPKEAEPFQWFKLLLLRDEHIPRDVRDNEFLIRARKMLRQSEKDVTDVIADYLRLFWQHILSSIMKSRGRVIEAMKFHVVITIPAIWENYARDNMRKAVEKAGILASRRGGETSLSFAPEPEAAALASLCGQQGIEKNDVFIVCDAGGGTVDLITYKVAGIDPVISLDEAVVGKGGLCGGIFIDEEFERMCKQRLNRAWNNLSPIGIADIMKDEWEFAIKPEFRASTSSGKEYIVGIPAEAFQGKTAPMYNDSNKKPIIQNGRIHFSGQDIEKAFSKSFSGIKDLIDVQIKNTKKKGLNITGIILVGGLGSSPFLFETLEEKYKRIQILQADGIRPRTAICRGAIYKGLIDQPEVSFLDGGDKLLPSLENVSPIVVSNTIARQSLGVRHTTPYNEYRHHGQTTYWNKVEEQLEVHDQMSWYLRKGQKVSKAEPVRQTFYRSFKTEADFLKTRKEEIIWQCDEDDAPGLQDETVRILDRIKLCFDMEFESLEDKTSAKGNPYKALNFDIEIIPSGASVEYNVYYKGEKIGSGGKAM